MFTIYKLYVYVCIHKLLHKYKIISQQKTNYTKNINR
jgi:hypothetical protein